MSNNKKYYYLKLKENFFDQDEIKVIKSMDKGDTYVCIMLEMYLRSLKREGQLMMTDKIPFDLKSLSSVLGRPQDELKFAIDLFVQFELIEMLDTGAMFMSDIQKFIGHGSSEAERKQAYRKRISITKDDAIGQCPNNRPPELELELELEKENKNTVRSDAFEKFWNYYDVKKNKEKARKLFVSMKESDYKEMKERLPKYIKNTFNDGSFPSRMHATTYLNHTSKRWMDDVTVLDTGVVTEVARPTTTRTGAFA